MTEMAFEKVFEVIQSNLVPKSQYDKSQNEIAGMKSQLEKAKKALLKTKLDFAQQTLAIDILNAEKISLEAEKKTLEVKFNEVSLKLKQKNNQYESLLKSKKFDCETGYRNDCNPNSMEKVSTGTQTIKREPTEIGVVNVPASSSSRSSPANKQQRCNEQAATNEPAAANEPAVDEPAVGEPAARKKAINEQPVNQQATKTGTKRAGSFESDSNAKRKRTSKSISQKSKRSKPKITCLDCVTNWGVQIEEKFDFDPDKKGAPDPKQHIESFTSFRNYRLHLIKKHHRHENYINDFYEFEKQNAELSCELCGLHCYTESMLEKHSKLEHVDLNLTNKEIFELYLPYHCHLTISPRKNIKIVFR